MRRDLDLGEQIYALECSLLEPQVRSSRAALERLLTEDFVEFGSSGRTFDREGIVGALAEASPLRYALADFTTRALGPEAVLATYRATVRDGVEIRESLRSSIWVRRRASWRLVFHQGTLVERSESAG